METIKSARNFKTIGEYLDESGQLAIVANTLSDQYGLMLFPDGHIMNDSCHYLNLPATKQYLTMVLSMVAA